MILMYLVKVSTLKKGQYFYEPDSQRHFCRLSYSRDNGAYYAIDVLSERKVLFDPYELVYIPL